MLDKVITEENTAVKKGYQRYNVSTIWNIVCNDARK